MIKERKYTITVDLLNSHKGNALKNAALLLEEAKILLLHKKWPGAYFLGCASIEETGKASMAFDSVNRNLANPAVQAMLKQNLESHRTKICMGLSALLRKAGTDEKNIKYFLDLNLRLYAGREKSLYADINDDNTLTLPEDLVRPKAATDAVRLADHSLAAMIDFFAANEPQKFTAFDDKFFVISKKPRFLKMMNLSDFWWFLIHVMKTNPNSPNNHFSIAAVKYWDEYYSKEKCWGRV
ncbi:MAG: AbiV family abortive infection protein [Candidatus Latescibacterota bacterium]